MKLKSLPSTWFNRNSAAAPAETLNLVSACKYRRHLDFADPAESVENSACDAAAGGGGRPNEKCHREVHFAFLPERYEPLVDDEAKEEKKERKKEQYKKVKKNVGKALRSTWKCLMLGLYNFALGYSTPITVAATFVPDFHRGRNGT